MGNVISCNHARKFTHFTKEGVRSSKPEDLSIGQKLQTLFMGISIPKPINDKQPSGNFETIQIQSYKKLEGWFVEKENHKGVVILFHGYSSNKSGILNYSNEFNKMGYSTLMMDFMGSGGSEGYETTIGYKESQDVKEAFDYIKNRFPNDKITLFAPSMGATAIMKSVSEFDLKADKLIIECPFGSLLKTTRKRFEAMGLPTFPFAEILLFYGGIQSGFNPFNHIPIEYAKKITVPTLLIYGTKDKRVTQEETDAIFQNLAGEKTLKLLKKSAHENYLSNSKSEWLNTITKFMR